MKRFYPINTYVLKKFFHYSSLSPCLIMFMFYVQRSLNELPIKKVKSFVSNNYVLKKKKYFWRKLKLFYPIITYVLKKFFHYSFFSYHARGWRELDIRREAQPPWLPIPHIRPAQGRPSKPVGWPVPTYSKEGLVVPIAS